MALYAYQGFSKDGKKVSGTIDAPSLPVARELLNKQGIFPTSLVATTQAQRVPWYQRLFARAVTTKEKILFTKQLAVLLKAGVPLLQALDLLSEQFTGTMRTIIISLRDNIKEGRALADAMSAYPKVFDTIYVQLVRAGEASGKLEVILERLTSFIEKNEELRKKVRGAMRQPMIQLVIMVVVLGVMMTFVVPKMAEAFASQGKELPWTTRVVVGLSNFIMHYWLILVGIIGAFAVGLSYWRSTRSGKKLWDTILLRIPLFGYFARMNAVVQFCYTLGMLLEGGVNLSQALDIVVKIIDNRVLADALEQARDKIIKQGKIAQYLKETNIFPPIAIYLIGTGEQTGQLDTMLLTVAANYEVELGELADTLTESLGPIMLIVMGVAVGFIVIAIGGPIMQMGDIGGV